MRARKITIPGGGKFIINNVTETGDNCIAGYGFLLSEDEQFQNGILLIKFDTLLTIQWAKYITNIHTSTSSPSYYLLGLHSDSEGTIFTAAYSTNPVTSAFISAIGKNGNLLWSTGLEKNFLFNQGILSDNFNFSLGSIEDKLLVFQAYSERPIINSQLVGRPGFIGYSLNKYTGAITRINKCYIPYLTPGRFALYAGLNNYSTALPAVNQKIFYSFVETAPGEHNLVTLVTDTTFTISSPRKLRGWVSFGGGQKQGYWYSDKGLLGLINAGIPATRFAVVDSSNHIFVSKELSNNITPFPDIQNMSFANNGNTVSLAVTDQTNTELMMQTDIPLYSKLPDEDCAGENNSFFTFDTVSFIKDTINSAVTYTGIVQATDFSFLSSNFVLQKQEFCKTKSSCTPPSIAGPSVFCISSVQTFRVAKNQGCFKDIKWVLNNAPADVVAKTDSTISLQFTNEWSGYIKAELYGCLLADSLFIDAKPALLAVSIGNDTTWCDKDFLLAASNAYNTYHWQDGSASSAFLVTGPGIYYLTTEDYCGNTTSDTVIVKKIPLNLSPGTDTIICKGQRIELKASTGFSNYSWSPAYNISTTSGISVTVFPETSTNYILQGEIQTGCILKDSIQINVENCPEYIYFPTGFTPNGDGKNDLFKPLISSVLISYEMSVYNRWGQIVFKTTDSNRGWDGRLNGIAQNSAVFTWVCKYQFLNKLKIIKKGTVMLIR